MENVRLEIQGHIATLTVDRPKTLNALNRQTISEIATAVTQVRADANVRAFIITGAGEKSFVAGADISEMKGISPSAGALLAAHGQDTFAALAALPCITIAAVNGFALGGGCELALACDLIYASDNAFFGLPEVKLGIFPGFGGTQRLARRIGPSRALEFIATGEKVSAAKAKEYGLALEVLPRADLLAHCKKVAEQVSSSAPRAVALAKEVLNRGLDAPLSVGIALERTAFAQVFDTKDAAEGVLAFLEKRPAKFEGR